MAFVYLLTLLFTLKQVYSQCSITSSADVIFGIDASTYVSDTNFVNLKTLAKQTINNYIPFVASSSNIGFLSFDSITSAIAPTTYSTRALAANAITPLARPGGTAGTRQTVQLLIDAKTQFDTLSNRNDKILIIFTSGNGVINDRTLKPVDVCGSGSGLKLRQAGVRIVVIGVSIDTTDLNAFTTLHSCLGKDPYTITDYTLSSLISISTTLQENDLCPDHYQLKITEVKPDVTSTSKPAFVELYNYGQSVTISQISLSGLFTWDGDSGTLQQGWYLVVYYGGSSPATCTTNNYCISRVASAKDTLLSPVVLKSDGGVTQLDSFSPTKFTLKTGFSFQLSYIQYNSQLDDNWEQSCTNTGTPGLPTDLTCSTAVTCSTTPATCDSGTCNNGVCSCASGYYSPENKEYYCKPLPGPIATCYAYRIKDTLTNEQSMRFVWSTTSGTEQVHTTTLLYPSSTSGSGTTTKDTGGSLALANVAGSEYDFSKVGSGAGTVYYKMNSQSTGASTKTCTYVTADPTPSPTPSPTLMPTNIPTIMPTPAPTPSSVWFYMSGTFCDKDRCMCSSELSNQLCCSDLTNDAQIAKWGCSTPIQLVTLSNDTQYPVGLQKADIFDSSDVCIHWRITHDYQCNYYQFDVNTNGCNLPTENITAGVIIPATTGVTCVDKSSTSAKIGLIIEEDLNYTNYTGKLFDGFYQYYTIEIFNCTIQDPTYNITKYGGCYLGFPAKVQITTLYGDPPQGKVRNEKEFPKWLWWVLILILLFLCIIALLLYKYCWKNRLNKKTINDQEEELMDVERENELGWQNDLDPQNANFNPMNPNVTGYGNIAPTDHVSPNKGKYGKIDEVVKVNAERFEERQEFGQGVNQGYQPPSNL